MVQVIYRIELKGYGPYQNSWNGAAKQNNREIADYCSALVSRHSYQSYRKHPIPDADGMWHRERSLYGFASMKQLHEWFTDTELQKLAELGFSLITLEVADEHCERGGKQVSYYQEEVLKSKKTSLKKLLKKAA